MKPTCLFEDILQIDEWYGPLTRSLSVDSFPQLTKGEGLVFTVAPFQNGRAWMPWGGDETIFQGHVRELPCCFFFHLVSLHDCSVIGETLWLSPCRCRQIANPQAGVDLFKLVFWRWAERVQFPPRLGVFMGELHCRFRRAVLPRVAAGCFFSHRFSFLIFDFGRGLSRPTLEGACPLKQEPFM